MSYVGPQMFKQCQKYILSQLIFAQKILPRMQIVNRTGPYNPWMYVIPTISAKIFPKKQIISGTLAQDPYLAITCWSWHADPQQAWSPRCAKSPTSVSPPPPPRLGVAHEWWSQSLGSRETTPPLFNNIIIWASLPPPPLRRNVTQDLWLFFKTLEIRNSLLLKNYQNLRDM